jgi:hypothetical protein
MFPKRVSLFRPWAVAMVAGATVDKPDYGKKMKSKRKNRRKKRGRKKRHAKKEA